MKLYIAEKDHPLCTMMREVSLKTLSNVNIRDPSHDKNIPIIQYIYLRLPTFREILSVKLANSTSPFKFRQIKFTQKNVEKLGLEDDKMYFH